MIISLIVAAADNGAIGKDNQLLWHLPNDLRFFKNTTWGMPVIMGRRTFESVNKPLPGRINIVITRQSGWKAEQVWTVGSLEEALAKAATTNCLEAFVIGGGEIYQQALPLAQRVYLTRVQAAPAADTFFPALPATDWEMQDSEDYPADEKHAFPYSFQRWERRSG